MPDIAVLTSLRARGRLKGSGATVGLLLGVGSCLVRVIIKASGCSTCRFVLPWLSALWQVEQAAQHMGATSRLLHAGSSQSRKRGERPGCAGRPD